MPMSILASVCWKAGSVWLCCGRVCGIPRVVACLRGRVCLLVRARVWLRCCVVACVPACVLSRVCSCAVCPRVCWFGARVWVCARVVACSCGCVWVCGGAALVCAAPLLVVCCGGFLLSRTPWGAVPLARPGLASRFGMLLGVSPVL